MFHVKHRTAGWLRRRAQRWAVVLVLPAPSWPGGVLVTPLSRHASKTAANLRHDQLVADLAAGNEPAVASALQNEGGWLLVRRLGRDGFVAGEIDASGKDPARAR